MRTKEKLMSKLLIVDDQPSALEEIAEYLRIRASYEIVKARSAKEAIGLLAEADLALVDMFMETPESGIDVVREAQRVNPALKCIVYTAHSGNVPNAVKAMQAGAYDYVEKQSSNVYEVLNNKVKQALGVSEEINRILHDKTYEDLGTVLKRDREGTLDILYKKTEEKEINLKTKEGKQIWQAVIQFHKNGGYGEEIDSIYSKLAEYSETKLDQAIYDLLFTINAGVTADIRAGFWLADKYTNYRKKKCRETLQRQIQ
jgi:DNA-binding NarL/FixJ family response regulator